MLIPDRQRGIGRWIVRSALAAGWAPMSVFGLHVTASAGLDAYTKFPALDIPMHILGGFAIAYFFARSLQIAARTGLLGQPSRFAVGFLVFSSTCTAAVFWEFAEWLSDRYLGTQAQHGLGDTLVDMLFGILGGTLFLTLRGILSRRPGKAGNCLESPSINL